MPKRIQTRATFRLTPPSEPKPRAPSAAFRQSAMARTQGVKSSSLSDRKRAPKETPVQSSMSEPPRPLVIPPPVEDTPMSPPVRHCQTRSSSHPPKKKVRVSKPELIDLLEPSSEPPSKPQPSQPPPTQSQIPSCMTPEVLIRRPMVTQMPIEGNLDCRARSFHSELCFDTTLSDFSPSSGTPSIYCRGIIWSIC